MALIFINALFLFTHKYYPVISGPIVRTSQAQQEIQRPSLRTIYLVIFRQPEHFHGCGWGPILLYWTVAYIDGSSWRWERATPSHKWVWNVGGSRIHLYHHCRPSFSKGMYGMGWKWWYPSVHSSKIILALTGYSIEIVRSVVWDLWRVSDHIVHVSICFPQITSVDAFLRNCTRKSEWWRQPHDECWRNCYRYKYTCLRPLELFEVWRRFTPRKHNMMKRFIANKFSSLPSLLLFISHFSRVRHNEPLLQVLEGYNTKEEIQPSGFV